MNLADFMDEDTIQKAELLEENNKLTEELHKLSHKHEELMQVYRGLMEKNEGLSQNHEGIMSEYLVLREQYEQMLSENPRKLKQVQEELIAKYNHLFNEHSLLYENHQKLVEDHESLKKIPIIPKISSTEEIDLILDDQLRDSNKIVNQELNSLRTYHQNFIDELVEKDNGKNHNTTPLEISQDIIREEEFRKFTDSDLGSLSNSVANSFKSEQNPKKKENVLVNQNKKNLELTKSSDLEKIPRVKIFEPFKIKENEILANSNLGKSLRLDPSPNKIFGPMRMNFLEPEFKNKYKGYTMNNLPDSKKSNMKNSSNIFESKCGNLKLSEFLSLKKNKTHNKIEMASEKIEAESPQIYGNMVQSKHGYLNKENRATEKERNERIYYLSDQNFRGKIIDIDKRIFEHAKVAGQSLTKLKIGCMKNKASVFTNDLLQIGCIMNKERNELGKNFLQISLYLTNKSSKKIVEGEISYIGDEGLSLWTKPQVINPEIKGMGQIRQELICDFTEIPFPLLIAEYTWR